MSVRIVSSPIIVKNADSNTHFTGVSIGETAVNNGNLVGPPVTALGCC